MDTYLVTFKRTLSVRHAVEETLAIEVEAHDAEAARLQVVTLIDGGDTEGQWEEGPDRIVGSDVVKVEFDKSVRSEHGRPAGIDREASFLGWLKLAADSPDRLRSCDVDRVMSAVPAALRDEFKTWVLPQISFFAVRTAIETWTDDD